MNHVNKLNSRHPTMFNSEEIIKAAEYLKEEEELLSSPQEIAKILSNWLSEQLEEIDLIYRKDSILQKRIFQLEVDAERELIETEDLVA